MWQNEWDSGRIMSTEVRASYTDSFGHAFDAKGRITVPAEWRQPSFEASLFVLPSSDRCLRVYPASWLGRLQEEVSRLKSADPHRKGVEDLATWRALNTIGCDIGQGYYFSAALSAAGFTAWRDEWERRPRHEEAA